MVREQVPAAARPAQAEAAPQVPAVYLPPFYQAERSLARALLRLDAARGDRLACFAAVDETKPSGGCAAGPARRRPRTGRRGPVRPDRQGRGPDGGLAVAGAQAASNGASPAMSPEMT